MCNYDDLGKRIKELSGIGVFREHEPMSGHCTFRAGGKTRFYVETETEQALKELLALLGEEGCPWFLLGNGSNLLVSDRGYDGVMIRLGAEFAQLRTEGDVIRAGAAVPLARLANAAADEGLTGLEFAGGIPGTLGGALVMNAGAYGGEMADVVQWVRLFFPKELPPETERKKWESAGERMFIVPGSEMRFSYRHSLLKECRAVALEAGIALQSGEREAILDRMAELRKQRSEKQPLEYPSAGSFFKRPEGAFAGKLIADAGCKGLSVGDACVSEKHAGFIINKGSASAGDIRALMDEVRERVEKGSGIRLEAEVILLGEFGDGRSI
ncbi:MAG: UDP-N-acetylmuramate dehydrogenase [Lachnospiraceae bacterium]|nr:UDP-N-acetylmuramate dehydrogenase [Lachnospiraceae bacterium]